MDHSPVVLRGREACYSGAQFRASHKLKMCSQPLGLSMAHTGLLNKLAKEIVIECLTKVKEEVSLVNILGNYID